MFLLRLEQVRVSALINPIQRHSGQSSAMSKRKPDYIKKKYVLLYVGSMWFAFLFNKGLQLGDCLMSKKRLCTFTFLPFQDRVFLSNSPGCLGTPLLDKAAFQLPEIHLLCPLSAVIKG